MEGERRRNWNWYNPRPEEEARCDRQLEKPVERVMQRQKELEQRQKSGNSSTDQVEMEDNASQEMETESSNPNNEVAEEETAPRDAALEQAASADEPRASSSKNVSSQFYIKCLEGNFRIRIEEGGIVRVERQEEETVATVDKDALSEGETSSSGAELEKETENANFGAIATVNTESCVPDKDAVNEGTISTGEELEKAANGDEDTEDNASPDEEVTDKSETTESSNSKNGMTEGEITSGGSGLEKAADEPSASCSFGFPAQRDIKLEVDEIGDSVEEGEVIRIDPGRRKSEAKMVKTSWKRKFYWKNEKTGLYRCKKCKKKYTTNGGVVAHYKAEHFQKRYKCDICNEAVYKHYASLRRHQRECTKAASAAESSASCLPTIMQSEFGINENVEEGEIIRIVPDGKTPNANKVKRILKGELYRKNSEDGLYHCSKCNKKYATDNGLVAHYQADHFQIRYKCDICNEAVYKFFATLWRHQKTCHGKKVEKKYLCQLCGEKFSLKKRLSAHQAQAHKIARANGGESKVNRKALFYRKNSKTGLFHCTKCNKKCKEEINIKAHYEASHIRRNKTRYLLRNSALRNRKRKFQKNVS